MRFFALFASLASALGLGSGLIDGGDRVLIIFDETSPIKVETLSQYFSDEGFSVTTSDVRNSKLSLSAFGDYVFDTVVLLTPNVRHLPDGQNSFLDSSTDGVGLKELIRYVDDGGNLLIGGGAKVSAPIRQLVNQFSMDFYPDDAFVVSSSGSKTLSLDLTNQDLSPFHWRNAADPLPINDATPVRLSPTSRKVENLLPAPAGSSITPASLNLDNQSGSTIALVGAMQTDIGSRVTVLATSELLSDYTMTASKSGKFFALRVLEWTARRSHVLRMSPIRHRLADAPEGTPPMKMYREGLDLHAEFTLEARVGDTWIPYYRAKDQELDSSPRATRNRQQRREDGPNNEDDDYGTQPTSETARRKQDKAVTDGTPAVQVSFVMLDPYVRLLWPLSRRVEQDAEGNTKDLAVYGRDFRIPDKCGIFKFVVDYKEPFYNRLALEQVLPIRNFKHSDHPRFQLAALPYYVTEFVVLLLTLVFVVVFLFHKEEKGQVVLGNVENLADAADVVEISDKVINKYATAPTAAAAPAAAEEDKKNA